MNAINYAIRQPNPGIPVALLEFGTDETNTSPTAPKISELKIRYFTNPAIPTSAFDFMVFNGKTRNIIAGQNTVNAYGSEPKFAVYDGFNPTPGIFPAPFSTGAVYGVSDGLDGSGSPVANAVGVAGDVLNSTASSGSFAVLGIASTTKGNHWAGYFSGRVFSTGGYLGSDRKLKRDVKTEEGALKKLMQLKPSSYYYNTGSYKTMGLETNLQHGFIAQELEEIFPEMIAEVRAPGNANNTFKAINYSGLHAIQVAAIQELKAEIDELKAQLAAARTYVVEKTSLSEDEKSLLENKAWSLSQNTPNPFSNATTIRYTIPAAAGKATIAVFDLSGKMLLQFDGLADSGQLTIQGNKLQPGMYLYSILHKGEEIFTRKMVLTR
ncbi:MAG TPA: tail fiber domain-containing protein [Flavisolibacter sp.]|nr:tail fiber domain-containing protein [Flavisolibacter sp.]